MDYKGDDDGFDTHLANMGFGRNSAQLGRTSVRSSIERPESNGSRGRKQRSDSEIARELAEELNGARVSPGDEEMARRLESELNRSSRRTGRSGRSSRSSEEEDAGLAQAIVAAEMLDMQERRQEQIERLHRLDGDYHRPMNFKPYFCYSVIALNTLVMLVEIAVNGFKIESLAQNPTIGPSAETLEKMGAKSTERILDGEFYRLFTPMILHAGFVHLLFNMIGLVNVGMGAEREFGHAKIATIYVLSGVFGVLLSAIFVPQQIGVGASGAIFGLFGSAWSDLIHNWTLYRGAAYSILLQLSLATIVNLLVGLLPFLDNFAHVGGFVCGLFLGFTLLVQNTYDIWGYRKARKNYQLVIQAASITVIPIFFVALLLILYLQVDVSKSCDWCSYISCVPLPPGVPDEDKWWDCSDCSMTALIVTPDEENPGGYSLNCPQGDSVYVPPGTNPDLTLNAFKEKESLIIVACKTFCYQT